MFFFIEICISTDYYLKSCHYWYDIIEAYGVFRDFIILQSGDKTYILVFICTDHLNDDNKFQNFVFVTADQPENLKQTISVGYGFDKNTTSLFGSLYNCTYQQTSTLCIPACSEYDNSRAGFVGNSLLWSFQSDKEGWTRIYDLIIRGTPFDEKRNMKNNLGTLHCIWLYLYRTTFCLVLLLNFKTLI